MRSNYLFTSESVSEGHPDKVCDRISDEVVDLFFREGPKNGFEPKNIRVACETLATTNRVVIAGETRGPKEITFDMIEDVCRAAIKDIGYEQEGFHWDTLQGGSAAARPVAAHCPGRRCRRQQGRGRGRPGHHVRLRLHRDAGTDAGAARLQPQDPSAHGARASFRRGPQARSRRQEPGDREICRQETGRGDPDRGLHPASRSRR